MIDHLLWAVPELERGIDQFAELSGVRAAHGGSHPGLGTHNALLDLGAGRYLEILASDPAQRGDRRSFGRWLDGLTEPRLLTWAAPTTDAEALAARALAAGLQPATIVEITRQRLEGGQFRGRLLEIGGHPFGLILPFFIQRDQNSAHPSRDAPRGIELTNFELNHPEAEDLRRTLTHLDLEFSVRAAGQTALRATLATPQGLIKLG